MDVYDAATHEHEHEAINNPPNQPGAGAEHGTGGSDGGSGGGMDGDHHRKEDELRNLNYPVMKKK